MRWTGFIHMLLAFSTLSVAYASDPTTNFHPMGFREFEWSDDLSDHFSNLILLKQGDGFSIYKRKNETLKIGGANLKDIIYHFNNDKFRGILSHSIGEDNKNAIIALFDNLFGKSQRIQNIENSITWRHRRLLISIRCGHTHICQIVYSQK